MTTARSKIKSKKLQSKIVSTLSDNIKSITCSSINKELKTKHRFLKFIGSGTTGYTISICNDNVCKKPIVLKYAKMKRKSNDISHDISRDNNDDNVNKISNITLPVNIEVLFHTLFLDIIHNKLTPHLNIFYGSINCPLTVLLDNPNITGKWIDELLNQYSKGKLFNTIKLMFIEQGHNDLDKYIKNQYNKINELRGSAKKSYIKKLETEFIIILFQLCYTLVTLQYNIVGFRHNDLKANNILVYLPNKKIKTNDYYKYTILGNSYYIPATYITIKLNDYDFSCSMEHKNSKLNELINSGVSCKPNPGYDLHMLLNNVYDKYIKPYDELFTIRSLIENIIHKKYLERNSNLTRHYRLNNYYTYHSYSDTVIYNIPESYEVFPNANDVKTPAFLLENSKLFNLFKNKPKNINIIDTFDSKVPPKSNIIKKRKQFLYY